MFSCKPHHWKASDVDQQHQSAAQMRLPAERGAVQSKAFRFVQNLVMSDFSSRFAVDGLELMVDASNLAVVEYFFKCHDDFRNSGKPTFPKAAFHYTKRKNLHSIRQHGLTPGHVVHGRNYGEGIYLGTNPYAFSNTYGDTGIIVLYLAGCSKSVVEHEAFAGTDVDSFCANKLAKKHEGRALPDSSYYDEIVVREGWQTLALIQYKREVINNAELMFELHRYVQSLSDHCFGHGLITPIRRIMHKPHYSDLMHEFLLLSYANKKSKAAPPKSQIVYCPHPMIVPIPCVYSIVEVLFGQEDCVICMSPLCTGQVPVSLNKCYHRFHQHCLDQALQHSSKCPQCRVSVSGTPSGTCPKGTLTISLAPNLHCAGFDSYGTFVLQYSVPSGFQSACHPAQYQAFTGFNERRAYLPDNWDGRLALKRLRYAFQQGLTFAVGTSLTTGAPNQVVWASIHHKTQLCGGGHGFPDSGYFVNLNEDLDALGVPEAADL